MNHRLAPIALLLLSLPLLSCGVAGGATCVENETRSCACPGETSGAQTCTAEGIWTACTCDPSCAPGWDWSGSGCVDVDECAVDPGACDPDADCTNTVGAHACVCRDGFEGDGFSCTNVDECAQGLDDCHPEAECVDESPGFSCTCPQGWLGDGTFCEPDVDSLVQDLAPRTVDVFLPALGDLTVSGLSRVGWDIEVIEVPTEGGRTHKEPGVVTVPDVVLRGWTGTLEQVQGLVDWVELDPPRPETARLTLYGISGEQLTVALVDAVPVSATSAVEAGAEVATLSEVVLRPDAVTVVEYVPPRTVPRCPLPGHLVEMALNVSPCYAPDVLELPGDDTSDPLLVPAIPSGLEAYEWMAAVTDEVERTRLVTRRDILVQELDVETSVTATWHLTHVWPARIHLFNPVRRYGYGYLVDLLLVTDSVRYESY